MKTLVLALTALTLLATPSFAQKEEAKLTALFDKADWPKDKIIECKGASKEAVTQVPKEIQTFARVVCTKTGHHFTAKRGWHWHYEAPNLPPFFASAGSKFAVNGVIPETVGHQGYFTKITVKRIEYGEKFTSRYPESLLKSQTLLGAFKALTENKAKALQISLTLMSGEVMVIELFDIAKPYEFAYVATIPGTQAIVLLNDLAKVQAVQDKLQNDKLQKNK
jgi:hypothetical protein